MHDPAYHDTTVLAEPSSSVAWPAIIAGGLAAVAVTSILVPLGGALGLAAAPWLPNYDDNLSKGITMAAASWLIAVQWVASGIGGYFTGRLRNKIPGAHQHEVFFRDTAHGFLSWGTGTVLLGLVVAMLAVPMDMAPRYEDGLRDGPVATQQAPSRNNAMRAAPEAAQDQPMTREEARKAAAKASLFLFLSMLIGAFVASVAAALGGRHRDIHFYHGRLRE